MTTRPAGPVYVPDHPPPIPSDVLTSLAAISETRDYRRGEVIFRAGDVPVGLLLVLEGRVRVVREHGSRRRVLHIEGRGGSLGEIPLFARGVYPATAIAAERTRLLVVPATSLTEAVRCHPELALVLLARLAHRARELMTRYDRTETETVAQRVARHLLERRRGGAADIVSLGMSQHELAEELGTVREVLVRTLRSFCDAGVLEALGRARYRVVDAEGLEIETGDGRGETGVRRRGGTATARGGRK